MKPLHVLTTLVTVLATTSLRADIYQWEYIDPLHPELGKQQSSTLAPDGAGRESVPHANLSHLDLSMAWLRGADLHESRLDLSTLTEADLRGATLNGANFNRAHLTSADLSRADLSKVDFGSANLTNANFAGADIRGAYFDRVGPYLPTYLTASQLYSTASYQAGDLSGITWWNVDVSGWNFAGQNLTNARFDESDLTGVDLSRADLSKVDFGSANLTNANFAGAEIRGAVFGGFWWEATNLTASQLYSTASYQAGDLSEIIIYFADVSSWNFAGQDLTHSLIWPSSLANANFRGAKLTGADIWGYGADFTNADARGSEFDHELSLSVTRNLIHPDGHVAGLDIAAGETLRLWDFDPTLLLWGTPIGEIPIVVQDAMMIDPAGTLRAVFEDDQWGSTITFEPGIPVTLDGKLELLFDEDANPMSLVDTTYQLFDWTGVKPTGQFDLILTQNGLLWNTHNLYTTGEVTLIGAVPEPSTLLLGGMALAVVGALSRRR